MTEQPEQPRHYPNDNCGDPNHDTILEAWYERAKTMLDRTAGGEAVHGDGDSCIGLRCANPEHGWTEYAAAPEQDEAVRVALDNLLRHHNAGGHPEWMGGTELLFCEFAMQATRALASPPPVPDDAPEGWHTVKRIGRHSLIQRDAEAVPAAPPLDVERLRLAMERAINNTDDLEAIAAEYARLHPADPEEAR